MTDADKEGLMRIVAKRGPEWEEGLYEELSAYVIELNGRGVLKQAILDFCTERILSDGLEDGQRDLLETLCERGSGWCTSGTEIRWPEDNK